LQKEGSNERTEGSSSRRFALVHSFKCFSGTGLGKQKSNA